MTSNGMRNKKNILILILFFILLGGVFYYFLFRIESSRPPLEKREMNSEIEIKPLSKVELNVLNNTYKINVGDGATVYDVMNIIQDSEENKENKNNFSFASKEYPGLGIFIDEINGIKGVPGKYWIYYINDKEASVGISKYILKDGDIISWKQE